MISVRVLREHVGVPQSKTMISSSRARERAGVVE